MSHACKTSCRVGPISTTILSGSSLETVDGKLILVNNFAIAEELNSTPVIALKYWLKLSLVKYIQTNRVQRCVLTKSVLIQHI